MTNRLARFRAQENADFSFTRLQINPLQRSLEMSLYFDAVTVLASPEAGGSLKSRIYSSRLKSSPPQIYALITEATKWNVVLKEVVDNSDILAHEPKVGSFSLIFFFLDISEARR